jgi:hypothetical protein
MICFTIKKSISHWWSRRKVNVVKLGRKSYRWILQLKLKYFEKATKIWQNIYLSYDITYLVKSELRIQNLSNIVWPSQNTWTLLSYISTSSNIYLPMKYGPWDKKHPKIFVFQWNFKKPECTAKMWGAQKIIVLCMFFSWKISVVA